MFVEKRNWKTGFVEKHNQSSGYAKSVFRIKEIN